MREWLPVHLAWVLSAGTLLLSRYSLGSSAGTLNNKPVIGILAHESPSYCKKYGDSVIYTDYVKFLHTGGARVVPIRINESVDYYKKLFNSINGVLFPGGAVSLTTSGYAKAGKILFDLAIQANEKGDYFPVWGTCLGFQLLTVLVADVNLLTATNATNLPLPLDLRTPEYKYSEIYGKAPPDIIEMLQQENLTDNDHHYGLSPEAFDQNAKLTNFYKMLSTSRDRGGKVFVSTIEGRASPVWGVQFHPEQSYNWNPAYRWLHSKHAVQITQYFANFFVDRARNSMHSFADPEAELLTMIENNPTVYLKSSDPYEAVYVFNFTRSNNF